jgi:hypothetical protein
MSSRNVLPSRATRRGCARLCSLAPRIGWRPRRTAAAFEAKITAAGPVYTRFVCAAGAAARARNGAAHEHCPVADPHHEHRRITVGRLDEQHKPGGGFSRDEFGKLRLIARQSAALGNHGRGEFRGETFAPTPWSLARACRGAAAAALLATIALRARRCQTPARSNGDAPRRQRTRLLRL